ncbi:DNA/RNA non-specific endonuclease [Weissella viridescens]|uniref:DNA/RNA non-specific endonuclease n=1 Tax=Weissella viridescens TaxID=1629 RepID=UPI00257890AB|nr:DNA/RNA non-specific endonuclease [Weissella viridescens]WJI90903.1 DNA/RNA non-specific endonuclease [Weissella viridescens]
MARRRKKQSMNGKKITIAGLAVAGALLVGQHFGLISEDQVKQFSQSTYLPKNTSTRSKTGSLKTSQSGGASVHPTQTQTASVVTPNVKQQLGANNLQFNGSGAYVINNNQNDLNANVTVAPYVQLAQLDQKGRPGVANAYLNNTSREYRKREHTGNDKKINPIGWHQMRLNGDQVLYNRGHSIAYALAGGVKGFDASEANPRNITTQTTWANQASNGDPSNTGQNYYESIVRKGLDQHKTIRYRVTPIYDGANLVPSGSKLEAKSTDGSIQYNVFIPNVQPGVTINYANGTATAS